MIQSAGNNASSSWKGVHALETTLFLNILFNNLPREKRMRMIASTETHDRSLTQDGA